MADWFILKSILPMKFRIDIRSMSLNAGIYFLQVEAGAEKTVRKLLVK